jgi:hypothetical protein
MSIRERPEVSAARWAEMHDRALEHAAALAGTDRALTTYGTAPERAVLGLLVLPPAFKRAESGSLLGVVASNPDAPGWVGRFLGGRAGETAERFVTGYLDGSFAVSLDAPEAPHPFTRFAGSSNAYTCSTALTLWPSHLDIDDIALAMLVMRRDERELWV